MNREEFLDSSKELIKFCNKVNQGIHVDNIIDNTKRTIKWPDEPIREHEIDRLMAIYRLSIKIFNRNN